MKIKTKLIVLAALFLPLLTLVPKANAQVPGEKRMLMVSAYYSPLPNQSFYMRGSYEADKRLNGNGTNGADGTPVYTGMLAAPRTYPFGTRISIPGLGVGEVHDRGGAIRARQNYDRIDVWMGYGEEGLSRALNWGMRLVEGEVFWTAYEVEPGLSFGWVNDQLPGGTLNRLKAKTLINPQAFTRPITKTSSKTSIRELQEALRLFGYYRGEVNGVYSDETRKAVLTFQLDEGVIPYANAFGAGHFGPKTQKALKTKSENFNSKILKEQKRLKENVKELTVGLGKRSNGYEVYKVQQMLWELGYYRGTLNGNYDAVTIDAVLEFQKDYGVVSNDWELGAGYFGKRTHAALVAAVDQRSEKIAKYPVAMQIWVPAKIDLPKLTQLNADERFVKNPLSFDLKLKKAISAKRDPVSGKSNPTFTQALALKDRGSEVARLQNVLIKEGYLASGLDTGYFGAKTQEALIQFQIGYGIVKKNTDPGAGLVGPKTRTVLNSLI